MSLQALALGCCFLFLGYYSCQFITATNPLRREYLGALALCTALHAVLAAGRAWFNPAAAAAASASTIVVGLVAGGCVTALLVHDKAAAPNPWVDGAEVKVPADKARAARRIVAVCTHCLWALAVVAYHLPYMPSAVQSLVGPYLGPGSTAQLAPLYCIGGAVATDVIALARFLSYVSGRVRKADKKGKND
ncbi:hypothetical protein GPECTOR_55g258 [Gonium pectorale]|uniref:Uncharacterized protein n=1 Tax=Gonium pectorale TaxID=33097 RepID=A0A150G677_GONPE|nr:hypothetical protein GPECTOR_55g258 [Gonium pectorale]|eukprot:KXZ45352.1 hypothetical protein GPECTOR_55g258 [Gonium pectorale]